MRSVFRLFLLFLCLTGFVQAADDRPYQIAIIIDDLGNDYRSAKRALELPGDVTYAVLPQLRQSWRIGEKAYALGREVMIHLPMQSLMNNRLGPGGLTGEMGLQDYADMLDKNLKSVPWALGVNNHMGSLLTTSTDHMDWLMQVLKARGLYFIDSRTNTKTVAQQSALSAGVATARRDIFLDNERDPEYIRNQYLKLLKQAKRKGYAIGIGHPYKETMDVLAKELPLLEQAGYKLVPVSAILSDQRNNQKWLASSSPSPKAAKNSKQ